MLDDKHSEWWECGRYNLERRREKERNRIHRRWLWFR